MMYQDKLNRNKEVLRQIQDLTQEQAIYRPGNRGNADSLSVEDDSTWCNQSSYDIMEATGVHMEAMYEQGNPYTKGGRYNTTANQMAQNIEKYRDKWAKEHANTLTNSKLDR